MGAKSFLLSGDLAVISRNMSNGKAFITVLCNGLLKGSSKSQDTGRTICVEGDEKNILFAPVPYTLVPTPPNAPGSPGSVLCKVKELHSSHISKIAKAGANKILYIGSSSYDVEFQVIVPATQVSPAGAPIPDTNLSYTGTGTFKAISSHNATEK
ncbi:hypothetical protein QEJ31_03290 [Pigmentibacter sp. JX0631]|uniref:hypothetical protein n=1 Tax=Pigmentibacter sp. JX0631 TaxID=2976982 RepID=UPI0024695A9E|nr:hypothetical protein [Pigmentibacter sp. JX0631]WGL60626.1 hypothetical protein QEJ31_03290 [Pigmentibacter sp. JX0631]